jgi:RES domain
MKLVYKDVIKPVGGIVPSYRRQRKTMCSQKTVFQKEHYDKKKIIRVLRATSPDDVLEKRLLIQKLMTSYTIKSVPVYFPKIYRVRPVEHPGLFRNLKELWSPPPDCVKKYGRVNGPGKPIFYAAENPNTALKETTPNGQVSLCLELEFKDPESKPCHYVVGAHEEFHRRGVKTKCDNDPHVEDFLVEEFRKETVVGNRSSYEFSSLVSEVFFESSDLDGLIYPSVQFGFKWLNIAFRPESVNKLYSPKNVTVFVGRQGLWAKVGSGFIIDGDRIEYVADNLTIENLPSISKDGIDMLKVLFLPQTKP